ncbi:hypothetical protein [Novosphingobium album (ex Liu et al. 2023)]|uniref:Uncharacterized protein n=1 Tax=Novosphingobium album (ex Liu et al. 2023) TaxID=3031130 RepID=A0ABT5WJC8_9SPHN|nr:hypothetical protein [Novosphingobium album (ex Liu et al. 2023)]MDE8650153.1 hypothetical protein [Novosphingobium album (ex Liu et al. 2023)]
MSMQLTPYGSAENAHAIAKVGKSKTPRSLADRMPSAELAAKVGGVPTINAVTHRVVRHNAR